MSIRNKVQLVGHAGQDPEIVTLESGKKLAKFSLATTEHYTNSRGERVEKTHWHTIVFWNRPAEIVEQYVHKGSQVAVEGKLATRSWEDEQGSKHYRTEVVAHELLLLGPKT